MSIMNSNDKKQTGYTVGAREHPTARTEEFDPHDEPTGLLLAFSYSCLHLGLLVLERKCCVQILIPKQPPFSGSQSSY